MPARSTATCPPCSASRRPARAAPLAGIRVVSLAQNVPGPVAIARLVREGATAVKIEPPGGDPLAGLSRVWYRTLHRGVTVERIDLKTDKGRSRAQALLARADLLISSQRPSALARLGFTARSLAAAHPRLRWLNLVGDTRDPERAGHDLTYQAGAGLVGDDMPRTLLADLFGAEQAVSAALLLLRRPPPAHAQVGLGNALAALVAPLRVGLTAPGGPLGGGLPAYRLYATRRGRVAVAALEGHFRERLYQALALPDGADLAPVMLTKTARQWETWALRRDLPIGRIEKP